MPANNRQIGGDHYKNLDVEPWDAMQAWSTREEFAGYLRNTAVAYLARVNADATARGGVEDVKKAEHVLQKLVEVMQSE